MEPIRNKVAESGIITLDLAGFLLKDEEIAIFDIKPFLFREMILREKDYRTALPEHDWSLYENKYVAVMCSADAIVPVWAYMLAASFLQPLAKTIYFGTADEMKKHFLLNTINNINVAEYDDKRVVIKGCGDIHVPDAAYVAVTEKLRPVVKSLMYGEPCSTVPVYKKPAIKPAG